MKLGPVTLLKSSLKLGPVTLLASELIIAPDPVQLSFTPSLLVATVDEITIFKDRVNLVDVFLRYDGSAIDLTIFDSFELHGLRDTPISSIDDAGSITANAEGLIQLNIGSMVSYSNTQETTLIAYAANIQQGIVLWDSSLPRSSITANIVDTFTPDSTPEVGLTNGIRIQLQSRTNNAIFASGVGFTAHLIEKGVSIEGLSTDSEGYLIVQDVSLDQLGEEITIAVISSDGNMSGLTTSTVEDLTTYLP